MAAMVKMVKYLIYSTYMSTAQESVSKFLRESGYGLPMNAKTETQSPQPPVEVEEDIVTKYVRLAGFTGPQPRSQSEGKPQQPPVKVESEDPLIRYLQSSGYGPRRV